MRCARAAAIVRGGAPTGASLASLTCTTSLAARASSTRRDITYKHRQNATCKTMIGKLGVNAIVDVPEIPVAVEDDAVAAAVAVAVEGWAATM